MESVVEHPKGVFLPSSHEGNEVEIISKAIVAHVSKIRPHSAA
jgi:hypothetical protein